MWYQGAFWIRQEGQWNGKYSPSHQPNLNDKELQDSYHVMGADTLLKAMLTAGEYANYLERVQEVNGFDVPMEELVEDVKN